MNKLQTIENVNLNEVFVLNQLQAQSRYNIGKGLLSQVAEEAGRLFGLVRKEKAI